MSEKSSTHRSEQTSSTDPRFQPRGGDDPESIFPFQQALGEMATIDKDDNLVTDIETDDLHPNEIDPVTLALKAPVTKVDPIVTTEKKSSKLLDWFKKPRNAIGTAVGATVLTAAAISASTVAGDKDPNEQGGQATNSASPNPGEKQPTAAPETGIGIPGTTLDTINTPPTPEMRAEALQPVTVEKYSTPEAALDRFEDLLNLRRLDGALPAGSDEETTDSIARRDKLDKVIFENGVNLDAEQDNNVRGSLAKWLEYVAYEKSNGYFKDEEPTYRETWTPQLVEKLSADTYFATVDVKTETNITDFAAGIGRDILDIDETQRTDDVMLVVQDGQWFIRSRG